jgi:hypothetical protein
VWSAPGATAQTPPGATAAKLKPHFSNQVAMDVSPPLRTLAGRGGELGDDEADIREEGGPEAAADTGFTGDQAVQAAAGSAAIPSTASNFEGLSNADNLALFGGRVNPPDPIGDVGPNHYVEMVNLLLRVYTKTGTPLTGPISIGAIWDDFAVPDCTDLSGDPVVLYDQLADRWILSQFTTSGLADLTKPF